MNELLQFLVVHLALLPNSPLYPLPLLNDIHRIHFSRRPTSSSGILQNDLEPNFLTAALFFLSSAPPTPDRLPIPLLARSY